MNITELREKIDKLDQRMLEMLNERAQIAQEIGAFKRKNGLTILDRNRETVVLDRLKALNKGPLTDDNIQNIFSAIIIACRDLQTQF